MCFDTILLKGIVWKFKPTVRPRVMKARLRISLSPKIPHKPSLLSVANVTESLGLAMMGKWGWICLRVTAGGWRHTEYPVIQKEKKINDSPIFSQKTPLRLYGCQNLEMCISLDLTFSWSWAPKHSLINNWGLLGPTWWVLHFSSWLLKTAFYSHSLGRSLRAHHSLRCALWNSKAKLVPGKLLAENYKSWGAGNYAFQSKGKKQIWKASGTLWWMALQPMGPQPTPLHSHPHQGFWPCHPQTTTALHCFKTVPFGYDTNLRQAWKMLCFLANLWKCSFCHGCGGVPPPPLPPPHPPLLISSSLFSSPSFSTSFLSSCPSSSSSFSFLHRPNYGTRDLDMQLKLHMNKSIMFHRWHLKTLYFLLFCLGKVDWPQFTSEVHIPLPEWTG